MRILMLSSLQDATGNNTTTQRIAEFLREEGHEITLLDCKSSTHNIEEREYDVISGLHAFHSGKILCKIERVPFIVLLGGTDMNENPKDVEKRVVIEETIRKAWKVIAFSQELESKCAQLFPCAASKIVIIPPSPSVESLPNIPFDLHSKLNVSRDCNIFLLPCGLRPVKDPLYLLDAFSKWNAEQQKQHSILVVVGPALAEYANYSLQVISALENNSSARYLPQVPIHELHQMMKQSVAVVNSSKSEGVSNAILESLQLGVPVIAKRCPGNESVITHLQTGLLYDTPDEFIELATRIITDADLKSKIVTEGLHLIQTRFSRATEKLSYLKVFQDIHFANSNS